ncbi:MAG: DUF4129 domain-containing protein [Chloroflexi bacterium]|nr:DUF4129 domain-containing protein [Chloroflexota bacterium]
MSVLAAGMWALARAALVPAGPEGLRQSDAPSATPEQLAALDAILARPEFQMAAGSSLFETYVNRFWNWLWSLFVRLLAWLGDLFGISRTDAEAGVAWIMLIVSVVVVIGVAIVLYRLSRGSLSANERLADRAEAGRPGAADERARARAVAQADPRLAVHHLYLAVLLRLDERAHLVFDGALTNREFLPHLTGDPSLVEPFSALVARFDRLWYGQQTCSEAEYAHFSVLAERVWEAAGAVDPPSARDSERAVAAGGVRP